MKKIVFVIALIIVCKGAAFALPIPGSNNEVYNGNFDIGIDHLNGWDIVNAVSAENNYLQCSTPSGHWDIAVTQWIDES